MKLKSIITHIRHLSYSPRVKCQQGKEGNLFLIFPVFQKPMGVHVLRGEYSIRALVHSVMKVRG